MSDCPNVEIREALPELLWDRLSVADASRVREHVAQCAECAAELELLTRAHHAYAASVPALDTAAIVRALPAPPPVRATSRPRRTYSLGIFQLAAAILVLLSGVLLLRSVIGVGNDASGPQAIAVQPADTSTDSLAGANTLVRPAAIAETRVLAMSLSDLDGLEADELETMLAALDEIDAAPAADPDTLILSVPGVDTSEG